MFSSKIIIILEPNNVVDKNGNTLGKTQENVEIIRYHHTDQETKKNTDHIVVAGDIMAKSMVIVAVPALMAGSFKLMKSVLDIC